MAHTFSINIKRDTTYLLTDLSSVTLRATRTTADYLDIDTFSPIFLRGDTIMMPSIVVNYYTKSLDDKAPPIRANDAIMQVINYKTSLTRM